jgi:predicted GNAT family N-acyltransferase
VENIVISDVLKFEEIKTLSEMVENVFDESVGKDYSEEGNIEFKKYITPQSIFDRINDKTRKLYIARNNNDIIGVLETKNKDHISLLFVKKEFHGRGIAKKLFQKYLESFKNDNFWKESITVNSSFYAEKIYSKMGFIETNDMQEKNGIKCIPMAYKIKI